MPRTTRLILLSILVGLVALALWFFRTRDLPRSDHGEYARAFEAINARLPAMVDDQTQLARISIDGPLVTYDYVLVHHSTDTASESRLVTTLENNLPEQVCGNVDIAKLFDDGLGVRFRYRDRNLADVLSREFRADDCPAQ